MLKKNSVLKGFIIVSISVIFCFLASVNAIASVITIPPDLNVGDEYRLIFVTSYSTQANSSDINYYNNFISTAANNIPELLNLGTSWTALGSTASVDARANTSTDPSPSGIQGIPIYRLDGVRVADNYDDLWDGTIQSKINVTENGNSAGAEYVWTGTSNAGEGLTPFELGELTVYAGYTDYVNGLWTSIRSWPSANFHPLYGISSTLTVVPIPSAIWLLSSGLIGLVGLKRRFLIR